MRIKLLLSVVVNLLIANLAHSNSLIEQAYSNFQNENYQYALNLYSSITGYSARMGQGSCAYRLEDYKAAAKQYTLALLKAINDDEKFKSLFNLANAHYKDGEFIKAIETYKYILVYNPESEKAQSNLWSAQSMLIDKIKSNQLYDDKESLNYEAPQDKSDLKDEIKKFSKIEKIGYLRTLIGDRVADGELNAIADNDKSVNLLISKANQIKNYLSAIKKLEFVKDNPSSILKSIIKFEVKEQ